MVEPEAIVAAAQRVLRERGVTRCTTREIAQVAGCSEGSIYNHFASKEALIAQAVGDRFSSFPALVHSLSERAGTGDVSGNLTVLARAAIGFFHHLVPLLGAMSGDPDSMRERAHAIDAQGHGPRWTIRAVGDYLRLEQELGRVRADVPVEGTAQCLVGACLQQALLVHLFGPELAVLDDETAATDIVAALVSGLEPVAGDKE